MHRLDNTLKWIITHFRLGAVASVRENGSPSVSPKGTFVIVDERTIAFGDIRSPGTVANLVRQPRVEVIFNDVLYRRTARITGTATIVHPGSEAWQVLLPVFKEDWEAFIPLMRHFVSIAIEEASLLTSPAYDMGANAQELADANLQKLLALANPNR